MTLYYIPLVLARKGSTCCGHCLSPADATNREPQTYIHERCLATQRKLENEKNTPNHKAEKPNIRVACTAVLRFPFSQKNHGVLVHFSHVGPCHWVLISFVFFCLLSQVTDSICRYLENLKIQQSILRQPRIQLMET